MNEKSINNIIRKGGVKKGFTLMELLVVISIALILMSIMLPRLTGYMTKAKNLKAENEAQQIYTAVMASYGEEGGIFVKDNIAESVTDLVGSVEGFSVVSDGDEVTIGFTVDNKGYVLTIDPNKNDYTLEDKSTDAQS